MEWIALGLVNWIATTILVESELFRPLRDWVTDRRDRATPRAYLAWSKLRYLVACHLCAGVWVAAVEIAVLRSQLWMGVTGFIATALLVKAVGHLVLELRGGWLRLADAR